MQDQDLRPFFFSFHAPQLKSTSVADYRTQLNHFCAYFKAHLAEQAEPDRQPRLSDLGTLHIIGAMNWQLHRGLV